MAGRASQAAKAAREAVYRRNLADDLQEAMRIAADLVNLVDLGKYDVALPRSGELQERTIFIQQRWDGRLAEASREQCQTARVQLDSIQRVLANVSRAPAMAAPQALERLRRACQGVRMIFVEEHAIAIRVAEGEKNEGR